MAVTGMVHFNINCSNERGSPPEVAPAVGKVVTPGSATGEGN